MAHGGAPISQVRDEIARDGYGGMRRVRGFIFAFCRQGRSTFVQVENWKRLRP